MSMDISLLLNHLPRDFQKNGHYGGGECLQYKLFGEAFFSNRITNLSEKFQ
jgi:hypothetical protein